MESRAYSALRNDWMSSQFHEILLEGAASGFNEVFGHALPFHYVLLRARWDKVPSVSARQKL